MFSKDKADAFLEALKNIFQRKDKMITDLSITEIPSDAYPSAQAVKDYIDSKMEE